MKAIINGLRYDTDKAVKISEGGATATRRDPISIFGAPLSTVRRAPGGIFSPARAAR